MCKQERRRRWLWARGEESTSEANTCRVVDIASDYISKVIVVYQQVANILGEVINHGVFPVLDIKINGRAWSN